MASFYDYVQVTIKLLMINLRFLVIIITTKEYMCISIHRKHYKKGKVMRSKAISYTK